MNRKDSRINNLIIASTSKRRMHVILLFSLLTALIMSSCSKKQEPTELIISAAASLKSAMEEIKTEYAKENSEVTITFNFAGSGTLEEQIREGAPTDIFISAAAKQMDSLAEDSLIITSSRMDLLSNEIVLIVPKENDLGNIDFEDITKAEVIALGDPDSVPAGQYAKEVFETLGIWDQVSEKATFGKDVTEVLAWVSSGNADAGVVYKTDAALSGNDVTIAAIAPEGSYKKATYPVAVIKDSGNEEEAEDFIEFLDSDTADKIFVNYGFDIID